MTQPVVGNATTRNGLDARWVFAVRPNGMVRATVGVRLRYKDYTLDDWKILDGRDFPPTTRRDQLLEWVRIVLAPHNVLEADDGEGEGQGRAPHDDRWGDSGDED
jgi:hypothetical protein